MGDENKMHGRDRRYASNRLDAREGESTDQQGSFLQCARSEQLSTLGTFEHAYCIDISSNLIQRQVRQSASF